MTLKEAVLAMLTTYPNHGVAIDDGANLWDRYNLIEELEAFESDAEDDDREPEQYGVEDDAVFPVDEQGFLQKGQPAYKVRKGLAWSDDSGRFETFKGTEAEWLAWATQEGE